MARLCTHACKLSISSFLFLASFQFNGSDHACGLVCMRCKVGVTTQLAWAAIEIQLLALILDMPVCMATVHAASMEDENFSRQYERF